MVDYLNPEAQMLALQEPGFDQQDLQGQQLRVLQDPQGQLEEHQHLVLQGPDFHQQDLENQELQDSLQLEHVFHDPDHAHAHP